MTPAMKPAMKPAMTLSAAAKRDRFLDAARQGPALMGIVNVTPDSFSDGGQFLDAAAAVAQAKAHVANGAVIVDVGAESTRPGHTPVSEAEEAARLAPVLAALIKAVDVAVSIDTTKAGVAQRALAGGAAVVNDQWGLQRDPGMARTVAEAEAALILMHNRDGIDPALDIVEDMRRFFERSLAIAAQAGIARDRLILDPGIGFGKTKVQNLAALKGVRALLREFGLPVLVGVSRKSLFGALLGITDPSQRLIPTVAANVTAAGLGATIFRVHDCAENFAALAVHHAIETA